MGRLILYNDCTYDATVVSNRFIDEYMKDANDAQLKVYLYLIRMQNTNLSISISDIADLFNHTEKDIVRALKYWERMKLLCLDYDEKDNITGIHIQGFAPKKAPDPAKTAASDISSDAVSDTVSDTVILPDNASTAKASAATAELSASTASKLPAKKPQISRRSYSADEIKAYKTNDEFASILFISEQYFQRPLTASDIQVFLFIYDELKFSVDLIDHLVQYCAEKHKTSHLYIEKVAINWAEAGITNAAQAKQHASRYSQSVYTIMTALGNHNTPTPTEADLIKKWELDYAFESDIILEACRRTVLATTKNRFNYADRILSDWYKSGVHHLKEVTALDEAHAKKTVAKTNVRPATKQTSSNTFNQFEQRSYNFDALEKELLSN